MSTTETLPAPGLPTMRCDYCGAFVPAASFHYLPDGVPLVTATCANCHRQLTMSPVTWHRRTDAG